MPCLDAGATVSPSLRFRLRAPYAVRVCDQQVPICLETEQAFDWLALSKSISWAVLHMRAPEPPTTRLRGGAGIKLPLRLR